MSIKTTLLFLSVFLSANLFAQNCAAKEFKKLEPKELVSHFFKIDKFINDKYAIYTENNSLYAVEFNEIKYLYDKTQALVFFSNYLLDSDGHPETCHACSGFLSIAKFKKTGDFWKFSSFTKDCECGWGGWGETEIPQLVKIGNTYFLSHNHGFLGQGVYSGGTNYHEINDYKSVLSFYEKNNSGGNVTYSYTSKVKLEESNGKIKAIVTYEGTGFIEEKGEVENISRQEIYFYDKSKKEFIKK